MLCPYGKQGKTKAGGLKNSATRRYNGNAGSPTRRMVENTPSMCAGHDISCPYNGKGRSQ